jgi:8-oxo-dGTP pyrophosphatase MutT (NUDIX family)
MDGLIECDAFLGGKKWLPRERFQFRPSVYGLVVHQGRVLLVDLPRTGKCCLPGGGLGVGERMEAALKREIREETGIEVTAGPLVGFQESFSYYEASDSANHIFAFYYLCTSETLEVCGRDEIDDWEADNPHWAEIESLRAEDFQARGELILDLLAGGGFGTSVPKQSLEAAMDELIECQAFLGGKKWLPRERFQFRPSVYGLVVHEGRILLVDLPRTGKCCPPGGGVEAGERMELALKREIREETGIEVTVGPLVGFREGFFYYEASDLAHHVLAFFHLCTPETLEVCSKEEIDDGEADNPHWAEIDTLQAEDFHFYGDLIVELLGRADTLSPIPDSPKDCHEN